jgi:hypothetical protein
MAKEVNVEMNLGELENKGLNWFQLANESVQW